MTGDQTEAIAGHGLTADFLRLWPVPDLTGALLANVADGRIVDADFDLSVRPDEKISQTDAARHHLFGGLLAPEIVGKEAQNGGRCEDWGPVALHFDETLDDPLQLRQVGLLNPKLIVGFRRPPIHGLELDTARAHGNGPLDKLGHQSEIL